MSDADTSTVMSSDCYKQAVALVYKHTGITISKDRKSMLSGRLRRRLRETGVTSFEDYLSLLKQEATEAQQFINCVTTNETYFYRTPRVWEHFSRVFLPNWFERNPDCRLNAWSAAASTGEEAHTMGLVLEEFRCLHPKFDYKIFGSDISSRVIEFAGEGRYAGRSIAKIRQLRPDLFQRFVAGSEERGFRVAPQIRERLQFKLHNLLERPVFGGKFDVIFLRNALIYFKSDDQEKILSHIRRAIKTDSILYLGESENLINLNTDFEATDPLIYRPI